jgi:hypothetical protein
MRLGAMWQMWLHKRRIAVGALADSIATGLAREEVISAERLHLHGRITPFEGRKTGGVPVHTLVWGAFVQRDRAIVERMAGDNNQVAGIQTMPASSLRNVVDQSLAFLPGTGGAP